MIRLLLTFLVSITLCSNVLAQAVDYTELFEVDLDEKLPNYNALVEKYINQAPKEFDTKYDFHWNIGSAFDEVFKKTIVLYGSSTKRVPHEEEKNFMKMIEAVPPEYWQYIGPYLHTVPGVPEKILNMPGIKETKNKFPTRIAKELEGLEDLEFLSPYLYFLLMPEIWPNGEVKQDRPAKKIFISKGKTQYNPEFFEKVKKLVPEEDYLPDAKVEKSFKSKLRTINPTKDSLLTAADINAFTSTIYDVEKWGEKDYNILKISEAGALLDAWDKDNGRALPLQTLKTMVHPCKRLAQKVKFAGLENDFMKVIGKKGFDLKSWAYTCDKTIKAYRISTTNINAIGTIMNYQRNIYEKGLEGFSDDDAQQQYAVMQAIAKMYETPFEDVMEVRSEKTNVNRELIRINSILIDSPIIMNY